MTNGSSAFAVGVTIGPAMTWDEAAKAVQRADALGLHTAGFWDHYHAEQPDWELQCGWSAYGYLAATTSRIQLLPLALCMPNYLLGQLAKETAMVHAMSGGRFEFGIGAGDYEPEFHAWGIPFPDRDARVTRLSEALPVLKRLWAGDRVTISGTSLQLTDAAISPWLSAPPRIVVAVGTSRRLAEATVQDADEFNIYDHPDTFARIRSIVDASGRDIPISVLGGHRDSADSRAMRDELEHWRDLGAKRYLLTIGFGDDLVAEVERLAAVAHDAGML